jgi:omega-amidase
MSTPRDLTVTLIQHDTRWHDARANRELYGTQVLGAERSDLYVLPETFTSGFTNETAGNAESMDGASLRWLAQLAADAGGVVTGSVVVRDGDRCANRLVWMRPDGSYETYDKRHLFRMAGEHERYHPGRERLQVELHGWRLCPLVCYDLRFPVYSRNRFDRSAPGRFDYDVVLYVANWPSPRHYAWQTLLRARAIENLAYCIGVNRTGTDGNQLSYLGGSAVLDYLGAPLIELGAQPQRATVVLSWEKLAAHRERFPAQLDADDFELK